MYGIISLLYDISESPITGWITDVTCNRDNTPVELKQMLIHLSILIIFIKKFAIKNSVTNFEVIGITLNN